MAVIIILIINYEPSTIINVSTLEITNQVSHYPGETVTQIDSNSAEGGIPDTHPTNPAKGSHR
jgi:hypothetical protein